MVPHKLPLLGALTLPVVGGTEGSRDHLLLLVYLLCPGVYCSIYMSCTEVLKSCGPRRGGQGWPLT